MLKFDKENIGLIKQFDNINWIDNSGADDETLEKMCQDLAQTQKCSSAAIVKAKMFELILTKGRIAIDKDDIFQDKIAGRNILAGQRWKKENQILTEQLSSLKKERDEAYECGAYIAVSDFGHTSPNSKLLLKIGFTGILERVNQYSQKEGLTQKQKDFYKSCKIYLEAVLGFIKRLAAATEPYNKENSRALYNITNRAPENIYEAMQLLIVYFFLHEYIGGTRVRTLGRLDVLLTPFYEKDIENKRFTKSEIKEMVKFFLNKFWTAKVPFDLPFCLSGLDEKGNDVTNDVTYLLVETYNELNIYSPKIHIRVSDKTPEKFVKKVLECIRGGNSSFVFVNDNVVMKSLADVGIDPKDLTDYVPIGCYEPAVWGKEIGCTGNGGINLAKAMEFVITNGKDFKSGKQISVKTGNIKTYEEFISAVKTHIKFMIERAMEFIRGIEKYYGEIGPDPMLSAMYDASVERGVDVYEGGAEYNNTSLYVYFIATLADSVCAVKKLVFEEKIITLSKLWEVLENNWEGNEKLRLLAKNIPQKYGNDNVYADEITKDLTDYCASLINNKPNSRGGVFKASCFCIDYFVGYGKKTMATPDGRYDGEILSKNLCATVGCDKNGVTALINSATRIDHTKFPNGTVLDVVLHPSAVSGDVGLDSFYGLLKTYMSKGGMALHGNVFDADDLKKAQIYPEKYQNMQVRVCGWNAYFVSLSKEEQDAFIKQTELNNSVK